MRFDLRVERLDGGRFRAKVVDALASSEFCHPFASEELEKLRQKVESSHRELIRASGEQDPEQLIKDLGRRLFDSVFSGTVRDAWIAKTYSSNDKKLVLRLLLHDPELVLWPWEYLHDGVDFLGLSLKLSIVRYPLDPVFITPLSITRPFRILGVIASPKGCQPLSGAVEWKNLNEALAHLIRRKRVALELLERPTLDSLHDRLSDPKRPRCHAVHFIGHGGFERDQQGRGHGGLYFEDENGHADLVTAEELGTIFAGRDLRLVVLNACNSARSDSANLFSSVAQNLIRKGVAGVVAMRYAVDDLFAVAFSHRFYRRLADGYPVELALTETRLDLFSKKFKVEWGNPILDLRSSDGRIFDFKPPIRWPWAALLLTCVVGLLSWALLSSDAFRPSAPVTTASSKTVPSPLVSRPVAYSKRCPSPPGLDMKFVLIEPGEFMVGSGRGQRTLKVSAPICMSAFETTERELAKVMKLQDPGSAGDLPARGISWDYAQQFIEALNHGDPDASYRLPSEEEWEYAAFARNRNRFSFKGDIEDIHLYGNCKGGAVSDGHDQVTKVGIFQPNDFGIFDMQGNVWEWVSDARSADKASGKHRRVRKGGSWNILAKNCTPYDERVSPASSDEEDYGFRIVRKPLPPDQNKGAAQGPPQNPQPRP